MVNVGILVSGNGTNMEAILRASKEGILKDRINPVVIISNRINAKALDKCKTFEIVSHTICEDDYDDYCKPDEEMCKILKQHNVQLVILAGYDKLLKPWISCDCILHVFKNRIINIHPSLLPAFPGINAIKRAFDYGTKITGCTIHWVDEGTDTGKIIKQKSCMIESKDTIETLTQRIHKIEHSLYVEVLRELYLTKQIEISPSFREWCNSSHLVY